MPNAMGYTLQLCFNWLPQSLGCMFLSNMGIVCSRACAAERSLHAHRWWPVGAVRTPRELCCACLLLLPLALHWPTPWTGKSLEQAGKVLHASGWAVHFWCERRTWHYVCAVACMWPAPAALADLQLACSLSCECICRREHLGADAQAEGACCCKLCRLARGDRQLLRYGCQTPPAVTRTCPSVNVLPLVYTNCNKTT